MRAGRVVGWVAALAVAAATVAGCSGTPRHPAPPAPTPQPAKSTPAPRVDEARNGTLNAVDDYERAGAAVKTGKPKKANPGGVAQYFADPEVAARFQGGGGIDAPMGCAAASGSSVVDGAIVGTPVPGGDSITVPVSLYVGTRPAARLTVTTDLAGKLTGFACAPAADPAIPGAAALVGYYGGAAAAYGTPQADDTITGLKQQFLGPGFASFTRPGLDGDQTTCAEDGSIPYWHAAYAPGVTRTGAQWYFWPAASGQVAMSVAVDQSPKVAWVFCVGQLPAPLAGGGGYSDDQVKSYVGGLFNAYSYLLTLKPFGADPSDVARYFGSDAAYRDAVGATGPQPLECSATPAGSINPDTIQVSGTTAVVTLASAPTTAPLADGETALGHPKATVDLTTMKITSVTCG